MKYTAKYALLFALAGGAALFAGCRADEEFSLEGYPQTPVGATISGSSDRVATFKGTYDSDGALTLGGSLSGEYTIVLAQASPEDAVVRLEPIIVNVPAELVEISAEELTIPAGSTTASVTVAVAGENYDFMENVPQAVTYELGVRVVGASGSQVSVVDGEARTVLEKEAYMAAASLVSDLGSTVVFKRNYIDGKIVNEDPIACELKVVMDRPVLEDTKFVVRSAGIPEAFAGDESFAPGAEVTIPAGEKESSAVAWSVADAFLEVDDVLGTFPVQLSVELAGDSVTAAVDPENAGIAVSIVKKSDLLEFLSAADASWTKYPTDDWTVTFGSGSGVGSYLFDGSSYTYVYGAEFVVDMKISQMVVGFDAQGAYDYLGYLGTSFEFYTSEDGESWTPHGELLVADAPNNGWSNTTNYVRLLKPCNARYVKWIGVGDSYIAEFYVYGKN